MQIRQYLRIHLTSSSADLESVVLPLKLSTELLQLLLQSCSFAQFRPCMIFLLLQQITPFLVLLVFPL